MSKATEIRRIILTHTALPDKHSMQTVRPLKGEIWQIV